MRTRNKIGKHVLPLFLILALILTTSPHTIGQAYSGRIERTEELPLSLLEGEVNEPPPSEGDEPPPPQGDEIPPAPEEPDDFLVVYTYEALAKALAEENTYTTIYLGDDITATEDGIAIHPSNTSIVIDGHPPGAPDGESYTFTQYSNNETDSTIYLSSSHTTKNITVRNLNIIGADLQSLIAVPENLADVTMSYENLTYEGPQAVKNPSGSVWLIDSTFTITAATGSLAEAGLVKMKGSLQVNSSELASLFWLTGESPELFVQENASVIVDTDGFFLHDDTQSPDIKIADNAFFRIDCSSGFTHLGKNIRNMRIGSDSTVFITQSAPHTQASLRVEQLFELSPNSMLNIIRIGAPGIALYFPHPQGRAVFNKPKRVILFSHGLPSIAFADEGVLEITTESINVWQDFSGMIEAPTHIWNNTHGDVFMLLGQYANAELQSLTHNLSSDAPITDPLTATVDSESHTLPNALVFVDKNGRETPLSAAPLTVHHQSKPPAGTSEITWNTDEGILLRINPGAVYSGATYTTTIQWTLVDAP